MSITHLLMCKPTFYEIEYSINPWMNTHNRVKRDLAFEQWHAVHNLLVSLGVQISEIEPVSGLPDMTFAGDCGMVHSRTFLRSNFRHNERKGEANLYASWLEAHGYKVETIPEHIHFEGLGDVIYHEDEILFGYGPRSDPAAIDHVCHTFPELKVRGHLHIADDAFFHVALAIAYLDQETLLYYPPAFAPESQAFILRTFPGAIPVSDVDARQFFVCNNVVIGRAVIVDNCTEALERKLNERDFHVLRCNMSEFKKSGGSLRCLVLKL